MVQATDLVLHRARSFSSLRVCPSTTEERAKEQPSPGCFPQLQAKPSGFALPMHIFAICCEDSDSQRRENQVSILLEMPSSAKSKQCEKFDTICKFDTIQKIQHNPHGPCSLFCLRLSSFGWDEMMFKRHGDHQGAMPAGKCMKVKVVVCPSITTREVGNASVCHTVNFESVTI